MQLCGYCNAAFGTSISVFCYSCCFFVHFSTCSKRMEKGRRCTGCTSSRESRWSHVVSGQGPVVWSSCAAPFAGRGGGLLVSERLDKMLASVIYLQLARQMTEGNAAAEAAKALRSATGDRGVLAKLEDEGASSASEVMLVTLRRYLISCRKETSPSSSLLESLAIRIREVYDSNLMKDASARDSMLAKGALAPVSWVPCKCHWRFRLAALKKLKQDWESAHLLSPAGGFSSLAEQAMAGSGGAGSPELPADASYASAPDAAGEAMPCWVGGSRAKSGQGMHACMV